MTLKQKFTHHNWSWLWLWLTGDKWNEIKSWWSKFSMFLCHRGHKGSQRFKVGACLMHSNYKTAVVMYTLWTPLQPLSSATLMDYGMSKQTAFYMYGKCSCFCFKRKYMQSIKFEPNLDNNFWNPESHCLTKFYILACFHIIFTLKDYNI